MKKILPIFFLLLLTGCFNDKAEVAIENCADDRIDYVTIYIDTPLYDHYIKNKKYIKLSNELDVKQKSYNLAISKFEIFIKRNYSNYEYILSFYKDYHYGIKKDLKHPNANYDYQHNLAKDKSDRALINIESEGLAETVLETKIQARAQSLKLAKYVKEKFSNEKLKIKFLLERYAKYYKKCELNYNKTPKTFLAKWSNN